MLLYALTFPGGLGHYLFRYQHPVLPLLAVMAAGGALQAITWAMRNGLAQKAVVVAALTLAALFTEQHYERWRIFYSQAALETRVDLAAMAEDLNTIIEPGQTLATHDIGAVGYYAHYQVLDLVGLVNPTVLPYHEDRRVKEYVEAVRPDYLLVFPEWDLYFLHIFAADDARFQLVKEYPGDAARLLTYRLYKVNWDE